MTSPIQSSNDYKHKIFFTPCMIAHVFNPKLRELKHSIRQEKKFLTKRCKELANSKPDVRWYLQWSVQKSKERLENLNKQVKRFEFYKIKANPNKVDPEEIDLTLVKQVPIEKFINQQPTNRGYKRQSYFCPLHNEKTPSFVVYTKQNSWYCFGGCAKGGDNIQLYQEIYEVDFKEAIKQLSQL